MPLFSSEKFQKKFLVIFIKILNDIDKVNFWSSDQKSRVREKFDEAEQKEAEKSPFVKNLYKINAGGG